MANSMYTLQVSQLVSFRNLYDTIGSPGTLTK